MDKEQHRAAKAQLVAGMQAGHPWQTAAIQAGLPISQQNNETIQANKCGHIEAELSMRQGSMVVELKPFNDHALNRDLETLCAKVAQEQPRLPDGRCLLFRLQGTRILHLDTPEKEVA